MPTFIHGIAASENIDSSGERISIAGMDISSLEKDGVFNWEHKADQPGQVIGKILKAKKIFSDADCEDDYQLEFFQKCGVPYLYVMGELLDDYKESAKEVAGMFRYDQDRQNQNEKNIMNFSIEGAKIEKVGMEIPKSIARKVTITVTPCNKAAVASMVSVPQKTKINPDELFKTEEIEIQVLEKSFFAKKPPGAPGLSLAPKADPLGSSIGMVGKLNVMSHAKPMHYPNATHGELKQIADTHYNAGVAANTAGNMKVGSYHFDQTKRFMQASQRLETRQAATAQPKQSTIPNSGMKPTRLFDPDRSGTMAPPGPIKKALDAGSGMAAPSQLVGGAALASESLAGKKKKKDKWLVVAEDAYSSWTKKEEFEKFMAKRMPNLTKGEIRALGQVMALNKAITMEKALAKMANLEDLTKQINQGAPMEKGGGKDSIYTLILFEGCDLHDILHCSHFATDDVTENTLDQIVDVCKKYFESNPASKELSFMAEGTLGKMGQPVLFLTEGDPYKDLWDELCKVAQYKYPKFKPHISVTSNVDDFKGKASCLVISVNGEVRYRFDFSK